MTLVVCGGTATEVGKTWIGAAVLREVRANGIGVAARKPAQSFGSAAGGTDADVLGAATGEDPTDVCPRHRWYEAEMAPPMAAAALGRPPFSIADLVSELNWPAPEPAVRWIETVGGVRSPLADDGDTIDLCEAVTPDLVVLVASAGLGTINSVRLCVKALRPWPVSVLLNRFNASNSLHTANRDWLVLRESLDTIVTPGDLAARIGHVASVSGTSR
jgi:dethiobiotin synthetase